MVVIKFGLLAACPTLRMNFGQLSTSQTIWNSWKPIWLDWALFPCCVQQPTNMILLAGVVSWFRGKAIPPLACGSHLWENAGSICKDHSILLKRWRRLRWEAVSHYKWIYLGYGLVGCIPVSQAFSGFCFDLPHLLLPNSLPSPLESCKNGVFIINTSIAAGGKIHD